MTMASYFRFRRPYTWPYEASLLHTPLARPEEPLEVLRTVHSFDPCMACACHAFDPTGRQISVAKIL
jgi:hydrogenase large subunit